MSISIDWNGRERGFCESIFTGPPEYVGSISSLFMLFFGLSGLFISRNHDILIRITAAALSVTGIGSTMYHWTLSAGWGNLDSMPMLIASWMGGYMATDLILYNKIVIERNDQRNYERASSGVCLFYIACLCFSLVMSITTELTAYFSIMFLISELTILISVILIRCWTHKQYADEVHFAQAFKIMYIGVGTSITAAVIWFTVENVCRLPGWEWMRYTYAHAIWHFSISFGMYYLMQFYIFVQSYDWGRAPIFVTGTGFAGVFYTCVPAVEFSNTNEVDMENFDLPQLHPNEVQLNRGSDLEVGSYQSETNLDD